MTNQISIDLSAIQKGQDKLFLFMREDVWTQQKPTSADKAMADTMGQRWTDFAKQGYIYTLFMK